MLQYINNFIITNIFYKIADIEKDNLKLGFFQAFELIDLIVNISI